MTRVYLAPRNARHVDSSRTPNLESSSSLNSKRVGQLEEEVNPVTGDLHH